MKATVYEIITERIIDKLNQGIIPWKQPWKHYLELDTNAPQNLVSKKPYRGMNICMLQCQGFTSPFWATYKQVESLGGQVMKGSHGTPIVWWNWFNKTNDKGKEERIPSLRYYTVFNAEQCTGLDLPKLTEKTFTPSERIERCEAIYAGMPKQVSLEHKEAKAYYSPSDDRVNMPKLESFDDNQRYYGVLYHELTHSTGHEKRLARKSLSDWAPFGSQSYAKEELVAELGSAFLCNHVGIDHTQENAAYIKGWLSALKDDSKLIVHASAQAQKACDFILGVKHGEDNE